MSDVFNGPFTHVPHRRYVIGGGRGDYGVDPKSRDVRQTFGDLCLPIRRRTDALPAGREEIEVIYREIDALLDRGNHQQAVEELLIPYVWAGLKTRSTSFLCADFARELSVLNKILDTHLMSRPMISARDCGWVLGQRGVLMGYLGHEKEAEHSLAQSVYILGESGHPLLAAHYQRELALQYLRNRNLEAAKTTAEQSVRWANDAGDFPDYAANLVGWYRGEGCRGLCAYIALLAGDDTYTGSGYLAGDPIQAAKALFMDAQSRTPEDLRGRGLPGYHYNQYLLRCAAEFKYPDYFQQVKDRAQRALELDERDETGPFNTALAHLALSEANLGQADCRAAETHLECARAQAALSGRTELERPLFKLERAIGSMKAAS